MNENYFSKIPNITLIPIKNGEIMVKDSIYNTVKDDKLIPIMYYLYSKTTRCGDVLFSINDIVYTIGYKPNIGKGKTNDKIKYILSQLSILGIITLDFNILKARSNDLLKCKLNVDYESEFIILYEWELDLIMGIKDIDKLVLLKLYCYLKSRMYKRIDNRDISATGGKAQVCYPSYRLMGEEIDIGYVSISKCIGILKDLKLIDYGNAGIYYPSYDYKTRIESPNVYALYRKDGSHKDEIKESIKFFKKEKISSGFVFINSREYRNNDRKLNGELGGLTRLKNQGIATESQLNRIEEIRELTKYDPKK